MEEFLAEYTPTRAHEHVNITIYFRQHGFDTESSDIIFRTFHDLPSLLWCICNHYTRKFGTRDNPLSFWCLKQTISVWPGHHHTCFLRHQLPISNCIDHIRYTGRCLPWEGISATCAISVRNDRQSKYILILPKILITTRTKCRIYYIIGFKFAVYIGVAISTQS